MLKRQLAAVATAPLEFITKPLQLMLVTLAPGARALRKH